MPFDSTKPINAAPAPVVEVHEPSALVEVAEAKKDRETSTVVFRGAERFSDEAAAHHRALFPTTSTMYSIGCDGDAYFRSQAGPSTSPWAFHRVAYLLGLLEEKTHHALTGHIFGHYDSRAAAWVIRKDQVTGATHDVPIVSIFELIQLLDARIEELGVDPDLLEAYANNKNSYAEREAFNSLPFEERMRHFRRVAAPELAGENQ
jgi:hypothetical protein